MRLSWWGALIALALIYFGGSGLVTYFTAGSKQTITIEELIAGGPATGWYEITGAEWNELDTLYQEAENTGTIQSDGMLVLVRPQGADRMAPVHVLLQQKSGSIASTISRARGLNATIQRAEMALAALGDDITEVPEGLEAQVEEAQAAIEESDALFLEHERSGTIEGLVTSSAPGSWTRSEIISTGEGSVATDFVSIEPGYEPNILRPAAMLGGGILLLLLLGWYWFGGRKNEHYGEQHDAQNFER